MHSRSMMALRSVCLWSVLLLAPTLWTLGVCQGDEATQKISVGFLSPTFSGDEGVDAMAAVKVQVPEDFNFDDNFTENLTIVVTSEDGLAKAGQDFEAVNKTITLTKQQLQDTTIPMVISLTEDDYIEPTQTFTLTLEVKSALDVVEEHTDSALFTILDRKSDRKSVKISFGQTTYTAYASEGTPLKVKVLKTGHIRQDIAVDVTFSNSTLIKTIQFEPSQDDMEVSFNPGNKNATYSLSLALAEPSQFTKGLIVFGDPAQVEVIPFTSEGRQILMVLQQLLKEKMTLQQQDLNKTVQEKYDDLQGQYDGLQGQYRELQSQYEALQKTIGLAVWFEQSHYTVQEDNKVRVCLKKNLNTSEDLSVTVTAKESSPASATGGVDFSTPHMITIPADNETACEDVDIITDDIVPLEGNETFTLTLAADDHPEVMITSSATVTIVDYDGLAVWFDHEPHGYYVKENQKVKVCLKKNQKTSNDLDVTVIAKENSSQSAENGKDFKPDPQTITIPADKVNAAHCEDKDIVINDSVPLEGNETFTLTLTVTGHPKVTSSATVTIIDDDKMTVQFNQSNYAVQENNKVPVCLKKNWNASEDLSVTVTAKESSPASATGGKDFSTDPQTITIPANSTSETACKDLDIIIDDSESEENKETFTLTLAVDDHQVVVTSAATVTITDDDGSGEASNTDYRMIAWVIVAVVVILGVIVAAYIIYHQRTKLKDCLAVEEQGGKGRRGRYKKLPANIREALHQD